MAFKSRKAEDSQSVDVTSDEVISDGVVSEDKRDARAAIPEKQERRREPAPHDVDKFLNGEVLKRPEEKTVEERTEERGNSGRRFQLVSYRGTEEQKALLDYAAAREGKSLQRYMEDVLMHVTEVRHGLDFDSRK